jgi:hypothetical protein
VLERALAELRSRGIDPRPQALTERRYIEQLQRTIYVRAIPDTHMVRIGFEDEGLWQCIYIALDRAYRERQHSL